MPEHLRSTVYAFDRCFEGALGAPAAPLVGLVAERTFGFSGTLGQSVDAAQAEAHSLSNAHALGKAMLVLLLLPWSFDFFVYFGETLYFLISVYKIDGHASDAVNLLCRKGRCSPWAGTKGAVWLPCLALHSLPACRSASHTGISCVLVSEALETSHCATSASLTTSAVSCRSHATVAAAVHLCKQTLQQHAKS